MTYCPYAARARSASNHAVEKPIAYDPPPGKTNVKRECVPRTACEALASVSRSLCRRAYRYVTPRQIERVDSFRSPTWFFAPFFRFWLITIYRYRYKDKIVKRGAKCWSRILFGCNFQKIGQLFESWKKFNTYIYDLKFFL